MIEKIKNKINWVKILFWVIIIASAVLWYHGLLDPMKNYLNSEELQFKLGNFEFTPFKLLRAFVMLIFSLWFFGRISYFIEKILRRSRRVGTASRALSVKILNIIFYTISTLIGLYALGLDISTITVFGGAIGIGIGFGLQKIASNFISGIILLLERSINEGDVVELAGGGSGSVKRIFARFTLIETADGKEIMVPNEDFITTRVTNSTFTNKYGRMDLDISISQDSDAVKAKQIMLDIVKNHPLCSRFKEPNCYLLKIGQFSLDFRVFMWLDDVTEGNFNATNDILFAVLEKFKKAGIKLPAPQQNINITTPASTTAAKKKKK